MKSLLERYRYGSDFTGGKDVHLLKDPTLEQGDEALLDLSKMLRKGLEQSRPTKHLVFCLFAGHAMRIDGH